MDWIFWLVIVIILSVIEICTINLVSIWFVASGIVAMILSFIIKDSAVVISIFILLGILLLILSRPIVKKLKSKDNEKTNLDRIIGSIGIVSEEIKKGELGEVKVDGKKWSAKSSEEIKEGENVKILKIDGVKLIVKKESEE